MRENNEIENHRIFVLVNTLYDHVTCLFPNLLKMFIKFHFINTSGKPHNNHGDCEVLVCEVFEGEGMQEHQ